MPAAVTVRCPTDTVRTTQARTFGSRAGRPPARARVGLHKLLLVVVAVSTFAAIAPTSLAADERPTGGRIPTVTRLVKLFLEREAALGDAIRRADAPALGAMLTEDFEMRAGARAATPIPRADWMREVLAKRDGGGEIDRMAVHDLGTVALVSFTLGGPTGPIFVVDVWRAQGEAWKLAVRYASPTGTAQFAIPGAAAPESEIPKKY